jgi:hypothetical protein
LRPKSQKLIPALELFHAIFDQIRMVKTGAMANQTVNHGPTISLHFLSTYAMYKLTVILQISCEAMTDCLNFGRLVSNQELVA